MSSTADITCGVLVIGAGLSGLSCARALLQQEPSLQVVVLEANERVGGRTCSIPCSANECLDVGGQWVGPMQPLVLRLIEEFGLVKVRQPWFTDDTSERSSQPTGTSLNSGSSLPMSMEETQELASVCQLVESMAASVKGPPWRQCAHAEQWDKMNVSSWLRSHIRHEAVLREMVLLVQTVLSCEPDEISLLYFLFYVSASGGLAQMGDGEGGAQTWRIQGGAQQLSSCLADAVVQLGGKVLLQHAVTRVITQQQQQLLLHQQHQPQGYQHQYQHQHQHQQHQQHSVDMLPHRALHAATCIEVHTENGGIFQAKRTVIAIPPVLWSSIQFEPALPAAKHDISNQMVPGAVVKVIALYKTAFWREPQVLSPQGHLEDLGPIANLFPGNYMGCPALIGLATANRARMLSQLPEAQQQAVVLQQYCSFWGTSEAEYGITAFFIKDWVLERYCGSCFAAMMPPGLPTRSGDSIRQPVHGVHWAATETARKWVGYMEGAVEAGLRAADEVLRSLGASMQPTCSKL